MRRSWGTTVTHAVVVMAVLVGLAGCWRQPGFNSLRQGWNPYEGQLTAANVHTLDEAWTAEVDDGPVRSDPVISGADLVHVSDDQAVYGLTPAAGERSWRTDVVPDQPAGMRAGPVSAGETTLQVPWGGVPDNGGTDVLDTATGTLVDHDFSIGVRSLTLRDPWRVSGYSGFGEGTIAGAGFRVDGPHSFAVLFGFEVGPELPPPTAAAISTDDRLFVGIESSESFGSDRLAGWDLESECELWTPPEQCQPDVSTQLDGVPTEPVVAEGGTVYVATDAGTVYAVDAATGTVQWTADVGAPVTQRPALTTRGLFVATDAGELVVLNASRCEVPVCEPAWSTSLAGSPVAAPAVAGGVVYVASTGGTIEAIPESGSGGGEPLWDTNLSAEITGGPTVGNGLLLAGTADGHVVAFAPGG
jgi:outer membrane protein assembly factor BamB